MILLNHLHGVEEFFGMSLFLHLLVDVPVQEVDGGIVLDFVGSVHQSVDEGGHLALVVQRVVEDGGAGFPIGIDLGDGFEFHLAATFVDIAEHLHTVGDFLLILHIHPVGEAGQVVLGEPSGHDGKQHGRYSWFVTHGKQRKY